MDDGPGWNPPPVIEKETPKEERAIEVLEMAVTGYSGKSKNSLIKEAIKILKN